MCQPTLCRRLHEHKRSEIGLTLTIARMFFDVRLRKLRIGLCQNCVTYPPKPPANTVIYGETATHINVAGSR
jgi:hypothetical protein